MEACMLRACRLAALGLTTILCIFTGCGGDEEGSSSSDEPKVERDERGPQEVLTAFLEASQKGDVEAAEALLSDKARTELKKENIDVKPPNHVPYNVGEFELVEEGQGAHVYTTFTEPDAGSTLEMLWVMRNDAPGWRIIGTIVKPPGMRAYPYDFEDVASMETVARAMAQDQADAAKAGPTGKSGQPASTARLKDPMDEGVQR
jgi:hypothetical protein